MTSVLEREMYPEAEAARLLGVAQSTLHYWLEGDERAGKSYPPIIRESPRHVRTVTWAEFVEASFLREYRRKHKVPMIELRKFVGMLREKFGVPYPLADRRPYISGRELVYEAQTKAGLDPEFCLVAVANDQLLLTPPSESFLDRITWDDDIAAAWRPDPHAQSSVLISPTIRFGRPAVQGVSTEAIWEQSESGEEVEDIARVYQLDMTDVRWALSYENSRRAA
ncbi:uncharacterized protein (DUF433 family) [Murinocardiopsis flavida]|uniref:Uncharacterized protein (DUF433 family) n=1 Tax=Murinocardiopsis flavida TaxID=645275 RepID=A0A2P8CYY2_9ACTN|nr:DUF433 domain-containing protein [Murinocardiopsis flavida]PSK90181.1 uncharacterized protein (DUF433 family) [Murinocardiopsis flavida]